MEKGQWCFPKEPVFNRSPKNTLVKQNREGSRETREERCFQHDEQPVQRSCDEKEQGTF